MNNEFKFPPNFKGLVLGCIDADFCKQTLIGIAVWFEKKIEKNGKLLTRSTRFTFMRLWEKRTEIENEVMKMYTD